MTTPPNPSMPSAAPSATILSWSNGSLAAYLARKNLSASCQPCSHPSSTSNVASASENADTAARTAELIGKIHALKTASSLSPASSAAASNHEDDEDAEEGGVSLEGYDEITCLGREVVDVKKPQQQQQQPALDFGCMLREMGEWCGCCDV